MNEHQAEQSEALPDPALSGDDRSVRAWARAHPVDAEALSRRGLQDMSAAEASARAFAQAVGRLDASADRSAVRRVLDAWEAAPEGQRSTWAVRFPAAMGGLNGVPFVERSRANALNVAGLLVRTERKLDGVSGPPAPREGRVGRLLSPLELWWWEHSLSKGARSAMRLLKGLRDAAAWDGEDTHVLWVSARGDGEFVVTRGRVGPDTRSIAVFVAGTLTFGGHLSMNLSRLSGVDGRDEEPESALGIYWQGAEFPRLVTDNRDRRFNRSVRSRLAAFDAALDLEALTHGAAEAVQTYIGHSYGGSAIGSAEAVGAGLTLDRLVYAGSPGAGMGIDSPLDTVNPLAGRFFLVSPSDWKPRLGRLIYGKVMGGHPVSRMRAVPLETGFESHRDPIERLQNHNGYLTGGSTSALNIKAVVLGRSVMMLGGDVAPLPRARASTSGARTDGEAGTAGATGVSAGAVGASSGAGRRRDRLGRALAAFVGAAQRLRPGSTAALRRCVASVRWPSDER